MGLKQWRQTAELQSGAGPEDGVDTQSHRNCAADLTHAKGEQQLSELEVLDRPGVPTPICAQTTSVNLCQTSRETALHRCWTCTKNETPSAYIQSASLLPEAAAKSEPYP
eukprot:2505613-Pyramimonas_sp.AAC.1